MRKMFVMVGMACLGVAAGVVVGQHINGAGVPTAGTRPDEGTTQGQPVEHRSQIGKGQVAAFAGQTRAPGVVTKQAIEVKVVAEGLRNPWAFEFLPGGEILVNEKPGTMRIVTMDGKVGEAIGGVPKVLFNRDAGLMDLRLSPDFAKTRLIYFAYVEVRNPNVAEPYTASVSNGTTIAKARLSDDMKRLEDVTVILRMPESPQTAHYGCRMLFAKDGTMFVTHGERYYHPTREKAQGLDTFFGKILRINSDGTAVKGNPFEKTAGAKAEIWTYGHRNPQGLAFHPETGELWSTEHGAQAGDEINLIEPGKNYGWPVIAYGLEYDNTPIGEGITQKAGMEQPVYYWDPAVAPCGCTFYTGDAVPEWKNNLFVACLAGQHVARLVIEGHKVVGEERLMLDRRERMRDIRQGPDGALYVVTDEGNGKLLRIGAKKE